MSVTYRTIRRVAVALLLTVIASRSNAQGFKLTLVPDSNTARFIVQETLIGAAVPVQPVGVTKAVKGSIAFGTDGKLDKAESKIIVSLTNLTTDSPMRDGQIRRQSLETETYPNAELGVVALVDLPNPVPMNGTLKFSLIGNLTLHGVTKVTTWAVTATAKDGHYVGTAKTTIRFDQFNIKKPGSPRVLSITDEARLELDFSMVREVKK